MNPVTHATNISQAGHSLQKREGGRGKRDGVEGKKRINRPKTSGEVWPHEEMEQNGGNEDTARFGKEY